MAASEPTSPPDSSASVSIEQHVKVFYDDDGWDVGCGAAYDATIWEDPRPVAARYQADCRRRVLRTLPQGQRLLDAGSGAVQHPEWHHLHSHFQDVVLLDLSVVGLRRAAGRGRKIVASALRLPFRNDMFDAIACINVINHVAASVQVALVLGLLDVLKPGGRLVMVSYNPSGLRLTFRQRLDHAASSAKRLYWSAPHLDWWARFRDVAVLAYEPYRFLFGGDMRRLIPDTRIGAMLLRLARYIEIHFPRIALRYGAYYMVTLTKL